MGEFQHGLFSCFENFGLCCITCFFPCYTHAKTAEAVGESCVLCGIFYFFTVCIAGGILRGKVRAVKNINGGCCTDFLVHWCCGPCAVVQNHREVVPLTPTAQAMARN